MSSLVEQHAGHLNMTTRVVILIVFSGELRAQANTVATIVALATGQASAGIKKTVDACAAEALC